MLQLYWNLLELHLPQQQLWAVWLENIQTETSESMEFKSHKIFSWLWKLVIAHLREKKKKKVQFIMVSQKLTPHEDLQPAHFRWSVFTEWRH